MIIQSISQKLGVHSPESMLNFKTTSILLQNKILGNHALTIQCHYYLNHALKYLSWLQTSLGFTSEKTMTVQCINSLNQTYSNFKLC